MKGFIKADLIDLVCPSASMHATTEQNVSLEAKGSNWLLFLVYRYTLLPLSR